MEFSPGEILPGASFFKKRLLKIVLYLLIGLFVYFPSLSLAGNGRGLYMQYCASCHHPERYGLTAPPLLPENLKRYKPEQLQNIIAHGLPATQMPSFEDILTPYEIRSIISFITSPVKNIKWTLKDIKNSRQIFPLNHDSKISRHPINYENIFLLVEKGKDVKIMDGDTFTIIDSFPAGNIHGGPKFSHSLKYVYAATRDGYITLYSLEDFSLISKIRAGINTRNIAISHNDKYIAVANYLPENIVILDKDLNPLKIIPVPGKIGGIYVLHDLQMFMCSFRDINQIWFIDYNNFSIHKVYLPEPFEDISIVPDEKLIIGSSRHGKNLYIYDLRKMKIIKSFSAEGMPHLASATFWHDRQGHPYGAINFLRKPLIYIIDLWNLKITRKIKLSSTGYFVRTHDNTPFIWCDTGTDAMAIIDKKDFHIKKFLYPEPGKKVLHTAFTRDGRYALVSIYETEGGVVIYDAFSLKRIKKIPLRKPVGKYNAFNKTLLYTIWKGD